MATNKRIQTTELDFDGIKQNLKNYLQGQKEFSDYDFEGSALSTLLDILTLNTHYNALYTNLAVNESFLDSASKRSSVVSKAAELGYKPRSSTAATAVVAVSMINDQVTAPAYQDIPIYTPFTTNVDGTVYTFYTARHYQAPRNGNLYLFQNVELKEGVYLEYRFTVDIDNKFILPNTNIDHSTIVVTVQDNAQSTESETFVESSSILNLDSSSTVYFIKELEDQTTQLMFGDGVNGKMLSEGNVINVRYLVCNQDLPNGASTFTWTATAPANTNVYVSTTTSAHNGSGPEDIESIRWNAPKAYAAQNRCVTSSDYVTTIMSLFSEAKTVKVWGGEDNSPPEYGKVFISVIPKTTDYLTQAQKDYINNILKIRKPLTVTTEIVDPTYIKIELDVTFYYNPSTTTRSAEDISALVNQTITTYADQNLSAFGGVFKYSKLVSAIDSTEHSITSNITTVKMHREITPVFNVTNGYIINLGNPIYNSGVPEESILSTGFYTSDIDQVVYVDDVPTEGNPIGVLRMYYTNSSGAKITLRNVGSVNYPTGVINIDGIYITGLNDTVFKLTIKGQSNDVISTQNQFVMIDPEMVTIKAVVDTPYKTYQFTSSRN